LNISSTQILIIELKMNENMKKSDVYGSALGPDWSLNIPIKGAASVNYSDIFASLTYRI